jgi:hypothetical protein
MAPALFDTIFPLVHDILDLSEGRAGSCTQNAVSECDIFASLRFKADFTAKDAAFCIAGVSLTRRE